MSLYTDIISRKIPEFIYRVEYLNHYTDLYGLEGILRKNKDRQECLWASGINYLNDSSEFKYTFKLFKEIVNGKEELKEFSDNFSDLLNWDEDKKRASQVYVISFSSIKDSLSQWRAYSGDKCGFSLNFSPINLRDYIFKMQKSLHIRLVKCYYNKNEHTEILKEFIECHKINFKYNASEDQLFRAWMDLCKIAPCIKHPKFEEEKEWRIIIEDPPPEEIKHRSSKSKSYLIPYVELNIGSNILDILHSITIGPTFDIKLTRSSISSMLGETSIVINETEVPYRNW